MKLTAIASDTGLCSGTSCKGNKSDMLTFGTAVQYSHLKGKYSFETTATPVSLAN